MTRYAALLRGIMPSNPNMSNEKLRGVFTGLGFESVASVLASGNIVFATETTPGAELEDRIQDALNAELGIPGGTIIRDYAELRALLDRDPFAGYTHGRETYLTATFFKDAAHPRVELPTESDPLTQVVGYDTEARAFLAMSDNSTPKTPDFMSWLERNYGKDITTRTWLTVQRIVKKMESVK
ncbi:DUF1697 domain-containing protein [Nocardia sp. NPDC051750]|uniref:DUF1697 domain-containing protein n=1 Tax=Nocardia sp. NPDC051750 TaxID=3364325 RepID=UPI00378876E9